MFRIMYARNQGVNGPRCGTRLSETELVKTGLASGSWSQLVEPPFDNLRANGEGVFLDSGLRRKDGGYPPLPWERAGVRVRI